MSPGSPPVGTPMIWTVRMPDLSSMPAKSVPPVKSSAMQPSRALILASCSRASWPLDPCSIPQRKRLYEEPFRLQPLADLLDDPLRRDPEVDPQVVIGPGRS